MVDPGARATVPNEADIWASGSGAADVASVLTSRGCDGPSSLYIDGQVATPNRSPQTAGGLGVMVTETRPDNTYKDKQTGRNKDNLMAATRPDNTYKNKQPGSNKDNLMAATRLDYTYKNKQTGSNKDNLMAATRLDNPYKNKQQLALTTPTKTNKQEATKTFMVLKK